MRFNQNMELYLKVIHADNIIVCYVSIFEKDVFISF